MPLGPGKYGANAEKLLQAIGGELCLVMIVNGPDGPSFDVAAITPEHVKRLPLILRIMADSIERDMAG